MKTLIRSNLTNEQHINFLNKDVAESVYDLKCSQVYSPKSHMACSGINAPLARCAQDSICDGCSDAGNQPS